MAINLSIDTKLLHEAMQVGGFISVKETLNQALAEFVQKRRQREITALFGQLPQDADYDYKQRRR